MKPLPPGLTPVWVTLLRLMRGCDLYGVSFNKSLAEARKLYQREVREKALKG